MSQQDLFELRKLLIDKRKELFERTRQIETGWQELQERSPELEEEAQKLSLFEPFDRLDERAKNELEQIDLALSKMAVGDYGVCESCGDPIALKRLQAIPWARLCLDCARHHERRKTLLPTVEEIIGHPELPEEYEGLSEQQIARAILRHLKEDGRIGLEELEASVRNGIVYLDGVVASENDHQIIIQILTDVMGFSTIVDRLEISEQLWERPERTPDRVPPRETVGDRLFYGEEQMSEDVVESEAEEIPYTPADRPLPERE